MINKIVKTIILINIFLLQACKTGCILPIDIANTISSNKTEVNVRADGNYYTDDPNSLNVYDQWLNTGLYVNSGDNIQITTKGTVYLCLDPWSVDKTTSSVTYNGNTYLVSNSLSSPSANYAIDSTNYLWTTLTKDSNPDKNNKQILVNPGDLISIYVGDANSDSTSSGNKWYSSVNDHKMPTWDPKGSNSCSKEHTLDSCWYVNGQMLQTRAIDNSKNDDNNQSYVTDSTNAFSLINCVKEKPCNFTMQNSGSLGFRILDESKMENGKHKYYDDNVGGYNITVNAYKCPSIDGVANKSSNLGNLIAVISDTDPDNKSYRIEEINGKSIAGKSGTIWLKVNDVLTFNDNAGSYDVLVETYSQIQNGIFSNFIMKIITLVETTMDSASIMIFKNITCSDNADKSGCVNYFSILKSMLSLYVVIYSVAFTFGLIQINQFDLVTRIFKISVIIAFMSDGSWKFFYNYFFRIFGVIDSSIDASQGSKTVGTIYYLIDLMTGGDGSNSNAFYFVDKVMRVALLDQDALTRLFAILFTSVSGIFFFLALSYFLIAFCSVAIKIAISYIMGFIYSAIMLVLAPLFIPCFLFSLTKPIFDTWLKYMVKYTIEPIMLIVGLNIISNLMVQAIYKVYNDAFCYKCTIKFDIGFITSAMGINLPSDLTTLFCIDWFQPWGYDNFGGGINSFTYFFGKFPYIILLLVLTKMLSGYAAFIDMFLSDITGARQQELANQSTAFSGERSGENLSDRVVGSISQKTKSIVGLDDKSRIRRNHNYEIDRQIKDIRKSREEQNRGDQNPGGEGE